VKKKLQASTPYEHPGSWNVTLHSTVLNISQVTQATPVLHNLGYLPSLPSKMQITIIKVQDLGHVVDVKDQYYLKVWLHHKDALTEHKIKTENVHPSSQGTSEVILNETIKLDISSNTIAEDQICLSVHKYVPILFDKTIGEISPPIPLITAISQPGTFQNCLLPIQHHGKITGKVHVQISFQ